MSQLTPPPKLYNQILEEIRYQESLAKLKRKILTWIIGLSLSWVAFLLLLKNFSQEAGRSGFGDLSFLIISDFSEIKIHFYDYILSLAESLPLISLTLLALMLLIVIIAAIKLTSSAWELKKLRVG